MHAAQSTLPPALPSSMTDGPNEVACLYLEAIKTIETLGRTIENQGQTIESLTRELLWLKRQVFGQKSDVVPPPPDSLAQDLFASLAIAPTLAAPSDKETLKDPGAPAKKKGHGRKPFPDHALRVEEIILPHDINCPCCGVPRQKVGDDVTEILDIIPKQVFIRRYVRPRLACPVHAEEGVVQAPVPARFIPKGNVGEGLLADILLQKFVNHFPLSRQEKNFERMEIPITVSTMVGWMDFATQKLSPIVQAMRSQILAGDVAYSDDTSIPVLKEDKKGAAHRGYMWVYSDGKGAVLFEYTHGRGQSGPKGFLKGFKGYLHADAYAAYGTMCVTGDVKIVNCLAHARRKFVDALKAGDERARRAVTLFNRIFLVDRYAKSERMDEGEIQDLRNRVSARLLEKLLAYLRKIELVVMPKSALGVAMGYTRNNWKGLNTFLERGDLALDNNLSERNLRQVVIGRKNYLFCGSENGAKRAAIIYSLVGTCQLLGIDPWKYLVYVFRALAVNPSADPGALTPSALYLNFVK